ncbi:MAG: hypothetical protein M0036_04650 [Desulfobacteraceae bacterium]|nr:hypothetical protein [Desulfobacteraceae bacterium]
MKTLSVIAPPGRICPKEGGKPAGIINDHEAVTVPETAFYRRMLKEGSLLRASAKDKDAPANQPAKKGGK